MAILQNEFYPVFLHVFRILLLFYNTMLLFYKIMGPVPFGDPFLFGAHLGPIWGPIFCLGPIWVPFGDPFLRDEFRGIGRGPGAHLEAEGRLFGGVWGGGAPPQNAGGCGGAAAPPP